MSGQWQPSAQASAVLEQLGWDLEARLNHRPPCSQRDAAIVETLLLHDVSLDELGRAFGLTRERIRQVLTQHTGLSTRDLADFRSRAREDQRLAQGRTRLKALAGRGPHRECPAACPPFWAQIRRSRRCPRDGGSAPPPGLQYLAGAFRRRRHPRRAAPSGRTPRRHSPIGVVLRQAPPLWCPELGADHPALPIVDDGLRRCRCDGTTGAPSGVRPQVEPNGSHDMGAAFHRRRRARCLIRRIQPVVTRTQG